MLRDYFWIKWKKKGRDYFQFILYNSVSQLRRLLSLQHQKFDNWLDTLHKTWREYYARVDP